MHSCTRPGRPIAFRRERAANGILRKRTGQNPPAGAVIYYFLKDAPKADTEAKIEILDASGKVIRKYSSAEYDTLEEPLGPGRQEAGEATQTGSRA